VTWKKEKERETGRRECSSHPAWKGKYSSSAIICMFSSAERLASSPVTPSMAANLLDLPIISTEVSIEINLSIPPAMKCTAATAVLLHYIATFTKMETREIFDHDNIAV
jgi:hypothetical protein